VVCSGESTRLVGVGASVGRGVDPQGVPEFRAPRPGVISRSFPGHGADLPLNRR